MFLIFLQEFSPPDGTEPAFSYKKCMKVQASERASARVVAFSSLKNSANSASPRAPRYSMSLQSVEATNKSKNYHHNGGMIHFNCIAVKNFYLRHIYHGR
jgi:hypothetical protein